MKHSNLNESDLTETLKNGLYVDNVLTSFPDENDLLRFSESQSYSQMVDSTYVRGLQIARKYVNVQNKKLPRHRQYRENTWSKMEQQ